jgi:hypothetical protein
MFCNKANVSNDICILKTLLTFKMYMSLRNTFQ